MIGYHSVSVIADAYMKGIRGFDVDLALKAMVTSAEMDDPGLNAYRSKGYISSEDQSDDVSKTLEYAYDDGCIARMLDLVNRKFSLQDDFFARQDNNFNLYDPANGFFHARRNGGFIPGFDPFEVNFHYTEANAWQYSLFAPQNSYRLIELHGGSAGFEAHLDKLFSAKSATSGREQADITGLIGQYAHGNEPSHNMAYLYNYVARPEKTRALVKRIMDEFYHDTPDGLIGNEDCGQMSAWYVMSALGIYQVSPGIDERYDLGYPLFDKADIHLPNGKIWSMVVDLNGSQSPDIPKDTSDYHSYAPDYIQHSDLVAGGMVTFDLNHVRVRRYYRNGGTDIDGRYTKCSIRPGAPVIQADAAAFTGEMTVHVIGCGTCMIQDDRGGRTCPMNEPFQIDRSSTVKVEWNSDRLPVTARFTKMDGDRMIKLGSTYANQYAAGGDRALVDGLRGGTDFRTGEWQGYQGQDVLATVDLGTVKKLKRAGLSVLQDQGSWIFFPAEVTFAWSMNGRQWSSTTVPNSVDRKADGGRTQELWTKVLGKKARYIKVIAKNGGPCPDWHPGKGGATWIFADEVLIEVE
jgi:hypothetical protein